VPTYTNNTRVLSCIFRSRRLKIHNTNSSVPVAASSEREQSTGDSSMQLTLIFSLVYLAPGRASAAFTFPVAPLRYVRGSFFGAQPESTKASIKSKRFHPRQIRAKIVDKSSRRQILARLARFALYWGSSIDSIQAVIANDYKKGWMSYVDAAEICGTKAQGARRYLPQVYSTIFYFARLRPRLLFSVGALFRALQVGKGCLLS